MVVLVVSTGWMFFFAFPQHPKNAPKCTPQRLRLRHVGASPVPWGVLFQPGLFLVEEFEEDGAFVKPKMHGDGNLRPEGVNES